jgi:hypothetical protein
MYIFANYFTISTMKKHILLIVTSLSFFINKNVLAQENKHYHDFGVMAGPVFFQSDYGERYNVDNFIKNYGFSVGAFYYLDNQNGYHRYTDYIKYRAEVSYMKNDMQHYGRWVDNNKTDLGTLQLRAMRGSVEALNLGAQIEFYPWKNDDYSYKNWNPYISFGAQYSFYTSKAWSELGVLGDPAVTLPKYIDAFQNKTATVVSLTSSIGTRYRLDDSNSLVIDLRSQYFMSDWVDGLNPDSRNYPENKTNDWLVWLNVGYIYSFQ